MPVTDKNIRDARLALNRETKDVRQAERELARLLRLRLKEKADADEANEAKRIQVGDVLILNTTARTWLRNRGFTIALGRSLHVVAVYEDSGRRVVFVRVNNATRGKKYAMPAHIARSMK